MVQPIQPSDSVNRTQSQSPQEQQKLFEIQFETSVISAYVSITETNGSVGQQLSQLNHQIAQGTPPDQLISPLNQLISQINTTSGKTKFPDFQFSTEGSQVQAISNYALSLQKLIQTAGETGLMTKPNEEKLSNDLFQLISNAAKITGSNAFNQLNAIIAQINANLPSSYQLYLL